MSTFLSASSPALNHLQNHWRKLLIVTLLIIIYALLGFLWAPRVIHDTAIEYVNTQLHRHLTLGKVQFNPFTFTAQLSNAKLTEEDNSPIGSFNELIVNVELSSLWHRAYTFKQVRITAPIINVLIDGNGNLNLAALKPDDNNPAPANTSLPRVRIERFELLQGQLRFEDRSRPQPFSTELKPLTFTLQNFRTESEYQNAFHFAAVSEDNEALDWLGDFTVQPFTANGKLKVTGLKAETIQSYLQDKLPLQLLSGAITLEGTYALTSNGTPDLQLALSNIQLNDIRIAPKDRTALSATATQPAWVTLPQLNISDTRLSLRQHSISIKQVDVNDAEIQAVLDAQHNLNLLQLLSHDPPNNAPWSTHVDAVNVNNATVHATDQSVQPATLFTLSPVKVQLRHFSSEPGTLMSIDTQLAVGGGQLTAQGQIQLDTLTTQLKLHLSGFDLSSLQNYVAQTTDMTLSNGTFDTDGELYYKGGASNKEPQLKYTGNVEVGNLVTQDKAEGNDFVKWQHMQLQNLRFSQGPDQLNIAQINMRKPYGRIVINSDLTTNIQHILRTAATTPNKDGNTNQDRRATTIKNSSASLMKVQIAKVVIEGGETDFADNSVKPAFASGIQQLNGTISGLSTAPGSRASVKLEGSVDQRSPVTLNGDANFLAATAFSDLSLTFRNMDLTIFNPYSGKFAGYNITKGKLATELHYQINNRQLDAQHHIVINQLEFGDATDSKDAVPLPIKLAVALLKDRNGVIDLNLPVGGSLDDPSFRVGPVVWQAFKTLLSKLVTSPFAALGSLFNGNGEELAYIDFAPGSAALNATAIDKLNQLSHALVERPQLNIDIPLTTATDVDAAALNQAALEQALLQYLPKSTTVTPQQRLTGLTDLFKAKMGTAPTLAPASDNHGDKNDMAQHIIDLQQQLLPLFAINAADRDTLTHQRADAVQSALLGNTELSAERIFLTANEHTGQSPDGVVRMELKLE